MPAEIDATEHAAWISVDAGLGGLYQADIPRFDGGLMDTIGLFVAQFLDDGGTAVILHKAGCKKTAERFLKEFSLANGGPRPWVDFSHTQEGETCCRTFGLPHYLGVPNVHAHSAHMDTFAAERCYRAAATAAFRGIVDGKVHAPMWFDDSPAITWHTEHTDEKYEVHLRSVELETQHPSLTWPETDFELYALKIADLVAAEFHPSGFRFFDSMLLETAIPCRILCFEHGNLVLYVTAGFGRIAAQQGTVKHATAFAEFAAFGPSHVAMVNHLQALASIAHATEVPDGVKDYDILSPEWNQDGYIAMPLNDLPFEPQALALRVFCPFFAFERPEMALSPSVWCDLNLGNFSDIYDRWAQAISDEH